MAAPACPTVHFDPASPRRDAVRVRFTPHNGHLLLTSVAATLPVDCCAAFTSRVPTPNPPALVFSPFPRSAPVLYLPPSLVSPSWLLVPGGDDWASDAAPSPGLRRDLSPATSTRCARPFASLPALRGRAPQTLSKLFLFGSDRTASMRMSRTGFAHGAELKSHSRSRMVWYRAG